MSANRHRLPVTLLALLMAGGLVSCQTSAPAPSALESGHWRKVRSKPPTYYPKGVSPDHPTGFRDGYWVYAGDAKGTRFFVPAHGTDYSREELIAEAQAAMTPAAQEDLECRDRQADRTEFGNNLIEGTLRILGGLGGG